MTAYYNEFDPKAAAWLRQLIKNGDIADGIVDERDIRQVKPDDLKGFNQCHFFAGIGVWSYALRLAGWPDDRPVWTASLPCQPFSIAGKQKGKNDDRHLLPHYIELVRECNPDIQIGEQVPGAIRQGWLDDLYDEMEREGYAVGSVVLTAAGAGLPHIRQRVFWMANAINKGSQGRLPGWKDSEREIIDRRSGCYSANSGMGDTDCNRRKTRCKTTEATRYRDTDDSASRVDWLYCRDSKYRPIKSGSIEMASRLTRGMVCCCNTSTQKHSKENEGEINGSENKTNSREVLRCLQQKNGAQKNKWQIGRLNSVQKKEILRQEVHGKRTSKRSMRESQSQQNESNKDNEEVLRGVWKKTYVTCSSCGLESLQQLEIKFDDIVRSMPQGRTLETFFCAEGSRYMQTLRKTGYEEQPLLEAQYPLSEVWKSLDDEEKDRVRMAFDNRAWIIREPLKPLVDGATGKLVHSCYSIITPDDTTEARTQRLKCYGNAIVAPVAERFIRAVMDVTYDKYKMTDTGSSEILEVG